MTIIGRETELQTLKETIDSQNSEFIAIYGRRRVGKTYLINEFYQDKGVYFELTGRKGASKSNQLKNFTTVFADTFDRGKKEELPEDWDEALTRLRYKIEGIDPAKKIILFFDELPWLASAKSGFLEALDLFWNRYMSRRNNVILVICGSAAAWMIRRVVNSKSGLHNRLTQAPINLKPFTLGETKSYLESRDIQMENKQIIDIYMALGGVAHYLRQIPRGKSSAEIISKLFFSEQAPLISEFNRLYDSLFDNPKKHIEVIKALSQTDQGLMQTELFAPNTSLSPGGGSVTILDELESCGFILKVPQFGKKKKEARYRLVDAFSLFYIKWIEGVGEVSEAYWLRKKGSQEYNIWAGYTFENICLQHYKQIIKALELTVTAEGKSGWKFAPTEGSAEEGAQIDLVIDRSDKCINLCEVKFYSGEYTVDKDYSKKLQFKKNCFQEKTKTKKTLFTTMISTYGVKKTPHYFNSVDSQLTMEALF
ncbi:MAG: AAA+ ATPase superfamily predicted ATPase [Chlamydiales bacterium]|jgi:AAA+ ATPase superfamily predicted ATPase